MSIPPLDDREVLALAHRAGLPDALARLVLLVSQSVDEKMRLAVSLGVDEESIILDPGPDFSKTPFQTIETLRAIDRVLAFGRPVLLALSRKDFVGALTRRSPRDRLAGTLAAIGSLLEHPGLILRVHDVAPVADYLRVADALAGRTPVVPDLELPVELRRHRAG